MKGYIYTMYRGADPGKGWRLSDPILGKTPTLGACVPNIRRAVVRGDHIFVVSGQYPGVQQYVVGGFAVAEKLDALAAYRRFPENRLKVAGGQVVGNVIVDSQGRRHPLDSHDNFDGRRHDYVVGARPLVVSSPAAVAKARAQTASVLGDIFGRRATTPFQAIGRWRRLDQRQIDDLLAWMKNIGAERPS